jgi:hypothetical protein
LTKTAGATTLISEGDVRAVGTALQSRRDRRGVAAAPCCSRLPVDLMHESDPELDRVLLGSGPP